MMSKYLLKRGLKEEEVVSPDKVAKTLQSDEKKFKNITLKASAFDSQTNGGGTARASPSDINRSKAYISDIDKSMKMEEKQKLSDQIEKLKLQ
jgi:hypothetical protein